MKTKPLLLTLLLVVPLLSIAQQTTYVPDDNFEAFLESGGMGDGVWGNDYVLTANINTVTWMDATSQGIADMTGIEDFIALENLGISWNNLTNVDFISNLVSIKLVSCAGGNITAITLNSPTLHHLACGSGPLVSLDVSNCTNLEWLYCIDGLLTSLDVSGLNNLKYLNCEGNNINHLDITGCTALEELRNGGNNQNTIDVSTNINLKEILCGMDSLTHLDVSSCPNLAMPLVGLGGVEVGLNIKLTYLNLQNGDPTGPPCKANGNPDLTCVQVNDVAYANANFSNFDSGVYFDTNCPAYVGIEEEVIEDKIVQDRKLVRIVDVLGRNVNPQKGILLLYIYDDGSVEKKVIID
jgi:hypothetical protein